MALTRKCAEQESLDYEVTFTLVENRFNTVPCSQKKLDEFLNIFYGYTCDDDTRIFFECISGEHTYLININHVIRMSYKLLT